MPSLDGLYAASKIETLCMVHLPLTKATLSKLLLWKITWEKTMNWTSFFSSFLFCRFRYFTYFLFAVHACSRHFNCICLFKYPLSMQFLEIISTIIKLIKVWNKMKGIRDCFNSVKTKHKATYAHRKHAKFPNENIINYLEE